MQAFGVKKADTVSDSLAVDRDGCLARDLLDFVLETEEKHGHCC